MSNIQINNLGLLNNLSTIINTEKPENINYVLARFLLENLYQISNISVQELTEECFTSRSAVRRFCVQLGYDNFSELKKSVTRLVFPSNLKYRDIKNYSNYNSLINKLIYKMINDIDEQLTIEKVNALCQLIYRNVNVVFLCPNNTSGTIIKFQQELMFASKIVNVISSSFTTNEVLKSLKEEDVIITISTSGKFAEVSQKFVKSIKGYKLLITGNQEEELRSGYDDVIYISKQSITNDYYSIYGKYGITYILDLISMRYLSLYS